MSENRLEDDSKLDFSGDASSDTRRQRDRDRNRIACKLFREKRKLEMSFLTDRNSELEQENQILRARIAQLQNEFQIFQHKGLEELETENVLLKANVEKHRRCVANILKVADTVLEDLAITSLERKQVLQIEIDKAITRIIGIAYASTSWVLGNPISVMGLIGHTRLQFLPFGANPENAHQVNVRVDLIVPAPRGPAFAQAVDWLMSPQSQEILPFPILRTRVPIKLEMEPQDSPHTEESCTLYSLSTGHHHPRQPPPQPSAYSMVSSQVKQVFLSSIWPKEDPNVSFIPEQSLAQVCVHSACSRELLTKLETFPSNIVENISETTSFIGVILEQAPFTQNHSKLTILGCFSLAEDHTRERIVDKNGMITNQFLAALQGIVPHPCFFDSRFEAHENNLYR